MEPDRFKEIHQMMMAVNTKPSVVNSYKRDLLAPTTFNLEQSHSWYATERLFWKRQVDKIVEIK
jgi:hypothetical protein